MQNLIWHDQKIENHIDGLAQTENLYIAIKKHKISIYGC
jgi:hypothetical protein